MKIEDYIIYRDLFLLSVIVCCAPSVAFSSVSWSEAIAFVVVSWMIALLLAAAGYIVAHFGSVAVHLLRRRFDPYYRAKTSIEAWGDAIKRWGDALDRWDAALKRGREAADEYDRINKKEQA